MTNQEIEHLFSAYAEARRNEAWFILWTFVGGMLHRDLLLRATGQKIEELEAKLRWQDQALEAVHRSHVHLYTESFGRPKRVTAPWVREVLEDLDQEIQGMRS